MAPLSEGTRAGPKRKPLSDATFRANITSTPPRQNKKVVTGTPPKPQLVHHESIAANGALTVRNATDSPDNKRLSAVVNESQPEQKRDSQISTTSTNASAKGAKRKTHIGPWELGNGIGRGCVGKVRKVRHSATGQIAAAKIISKRVAEKARAESLMSLVEKSKNVRAPGPPDSYVTPFGIEREIVIMKLLEHPNVVKLYDLWENREEMYIIMEYVDGGELFEYITTRGLLNEDETVYLFRQAVAALLHCHRIGIHHRDLKPENILLERDTLRLKIADFGMAALQPKGTLLNTPCGSVHYAAPEVFEKNYDGGKADVWSLGVILYVMLTGTTPFQHKREMEDDVMRWYLLLKSGRFHVYEYMSKEAIDLIRRMLAPEARDRITLEAVWRHPLLHKYEEEWGESPESGRIENWVGPKLVIDSWKLQAKQDIDRALLRSLTTLWHHEKEEVIINRLLNKEPNQEKYFYSALLKYQEEQLENYIGPPNGVAYSASDYHHVKPEETSADVPPLPSKPPSRSKSAYSILKEEHVRSKASIVKSEESYDPFRSSQNALVTDQGNYNVTIHRKSSTASQPQSPRRPGSLRVHALRKEQRRVSRNPSTSSVLKIAVSPNSATVQRRSISKASLASSQPGGSPIALYVKQNSAHKRGVDFSAVRRSSTASRLKTPGGTSLNEENSAQEAQEIKSASPGSLEALSTPQLSGSGQVRSRKERDNGEKPQSSLRKSHTHSQVIEFEARKVSSELEKFCQDAFFRDSNGSSNRTDATPRPSPYETPPSSVASYVPHPQSANSTSIARSRQRSLPEAPQETPNTFITRELAEARKKIAARCFTDENAQNATYQQIIAQLDALLNPETKTSAQHEGRRIVSAPETRSPEYSSPLPVINEENKFADAEETALPDVSGKMPKPHSRHDGRVENIPKSEVEWKRTIRVIESDSQPRIPPLVIRKTSGSSDNSHPSEPKSYGPPRFYSAGSSDFLNAHVPAVQPLSPSQLAIPERTIPFQQVESKKKHWFRRNAAKHNRSGEHAVEVELYGEDFSAGINSHADPRYGTEESNSTYQAPPAAQGKRPGFLRFFGKRRPRKQNYQDTRMIIGGDEDERDSITSGLSEFHPGAPPERSTATSEDRDPRDFGVQRSWFARFLNIKPASTTLYFRTTRGKARGEIVRLLRHWQVHGIRNIEVDRERNMVSARLSSDNRKWISADPPMLDLRGILLANRRFPGLRMKEVTFVVELFVVLEHGRRAQLSIARFTQQRGAASSFKRIVDTVESILGERMLLVQDLDMRRGMAGLLG